VAHRYGIAIDGYHRIAAHVFGERSLEARHMRRVVANEFPLDLTFFTRVQWRDQGRTADVLELNRLVAKAYGDFTWRNLLRRAGYSRAAELLYAMARRAYRFLRRIGLAPARK
jgi:hypothetical protein